MTEPIRDEDYVTLARFRYELRRFLRFSETAASGAGLTMQQHQALLAIRATPRGELPMGKLAERLLLRPHSATELVDRMEALELVRRTEEGPDRRQVTVSMTPRAEALLASLSEIHRTELRQLRPLLTRLLADL